MPCIRLRHESRYTGAGFWRMPAVSPSSSVDAAPGQRIASALGLVNLTPLMERTRGRAEIVIALLDGPVLANHPDLNTQALRSDRSDGQEPVWCEGPACMHGTFVAGILSAKRESDAPAICPECTLLVQPIFSGASAGAEPLPSAAPQQLAASLVAAVDAGARLLNLSAALLHLPSAGEERALTGALDYAAHRGAMVVAAAGNQRQVGTTIITRHPAVLPVSACDRRGLPLTHSNLGHSTAVRGLRAPGQGIKSLSVDAGGVTAGGTSVAAPFVTGALALVWSEFPRATADDVRRAVAGAHRYRPRTVVPPLLNAMAICTAMGTLHTPGRIQ
jgi:subtilisin family serine protease